MMSERMTGVQAAGEIAMTHHDSRLKRGETNADSALITSIDRLFYPRGVAVIGSVSEGKLGYEILRQMLDGGYRDVFVVNPRVRGALSVPAYDSVSKIDHPVDLAIIVSPPQTVPGVVAECGREGIAAAVIITAGFSEVGNHAGEQEIQDAAHRHGVRFVGPNCAGILNTANKLFPTLETRPPAGGVALVAQSGAIGGVFLAWARDHGLGVSKFVSYGNRGDLTEIDFLRYLAGDVKTRVVALYIESVTDGREFMEAVRACADRKPVVVLKAGTTQSGQRAALSHTGSMAGADAVYDAALRASGAIRVHSIEEMFDLCKAFISVPLPKGTRVAVVTNSGGPGVLAADRAEAVGLDVAEPSRQVRARLSEFLPAHCAFKNPIDLTVEGTEYGYRETLLALLKEFDAVLALNIAPPYLDSMPLARGICDAAEQVTESGDKVVVASFLPEWVVETSIPYLEQRGVPNFATGERALLALKRMTDYQAYKAFHGANGRLLPEPDGEQGRLPGTGQMLEPEAMSWLRDEGIPVPDFRFATTCEAAVQGCRDIGYPVVMKVVSPDILHKSDCGGVVLNIADDEAARAAFRAIERAAAGKDFRGVIIYPMIVGAQEVLLGLSRDPQYGPVLTFGLGGIYTEIWRDISLRVAPVDRKEAEAMIREIRALPLLQGARGQMPCDLDALAEILVNFSQLPFRFPEIGEIDLNPVFLLAEGLVVGDARVIRNGR
jgi:acyl-CoA synthetase (NDP forming)